MDLCDPASPFLVRFGTGRIFLFPKVKLALKGERFSDISDIQHGLTEDLYKRSQCCMDLGGDYIESL
jgi:hypothetical protein